MAAPPRRVRTMSPARARALLIGSALMLVAVLGAWVAWPSADGAADLRGVAPLSTTSVPATSTTSTTVVATTVSPLPATTVPPPAPPAGPSRLRIPSIGLDAAVVPVGLRLDGQMEVPPATDVGWYRLGPVPGATGSAVLAAHVDQAGRRGAFFDLRSVPVGAEVTVDGGGGPQTFVVTSREQVAKTAVELGRYFTAQGPARLTLITCGGVFDRSARHYQDNIIVTAELVRP